MSAIAGDRISVVFGAGRSKLVAVNDVTVFADRGETVGIVGESGSGKTTLARVLVGLLRPSTGDVTVGDRAVWGAAKQLRFDPTARRQVQVVFQDPYSSLNPRQRAWESVAEALQVTRGFSRSRARTAAFDLLGELGVSSEQGSAYPASLSGGQRQRVNIARALAPEPRVLVADEPTSALDQSVQALLLNLIRRIQAERDLAVVFISHDLGIVRFLTSRLYVMKGGGVVEAGPTERVFASPSAEYTRELIASRLRPGQFRRDQTRLRGR